jgi:hypothetical protein
MDYCGNSAQSGHCSDPNQNPQILWGFIDEERNSILKEYTLSAGQGVTVRPAACQSIPKPENNIRLQDCRADLPLRHQ